MDTTLMYVLTAGGIVLAAIVEFYILFLIFKGLLGILRIALRKTSVLASQRLYALKHEMCENICKRHNLTVIDDDDVFIRDTIAKYLSTLSINELSTYNDKYKLPNNLNLYACRLYYALGFSDEDPCASRYVIEGNLVAQVIVDTVTRNVFMNEFRA